MKKIMRTGMILCSFLLASIAWALAWAEEGNQSNGVTITSDLSQALVNQETVYSVTTTKGTYTGGNVRVTVTADEGTDLNSLSFWYYEPNVEPKGWREWQPLSEGFGPTTGFPLIDGTSYFKVNPTTAGTYIYTMKVETVGENPEVLATAVCTLKAVDALTVPYASITTKGESGDKTVYYASIPEAVLFAQEEETIELSARKTFTLNEPLTISKAITLGNADFNSKVTITAASAESFKASSHKNLVTVTGGDAGKAVTLRNLHITGSHGSGMNVQTPMTTNLVGVQLYRNANAGLLVHSTVIASQLETDENGWGGVNIDKGSPEYPRKLTIKSNGYNFREKVKIWAEKENCPNPQELVVFEPGENVTTLIYDWQIVQGRGGNPEKDMIYWVTTKYPKSSTFTSRFTSDYSTSDKNGVTYYNTNFYANGNTVTVFDNPDGTTTISLSDDDQIVLPYGNRVSLYGGAKDETVPASTINMFGGQLRNLYGGGYGTITNTNNQKNGKQADVTGSTNITIAGGTVTNMLVAGGQYYSKSNEVTMKVTGENTSLNWVLGGGYDAGKTSNTIDTEFDQSVNGTSKTTMSITDASASIICAGGGQGISYSKEVEATLNNVKISGGLLGTGSNGRSDNVTITATGCTFTKGSDPIEIAAVNRGRVENITINIEDCTFSGNAEDYYAYAGATYNWSASGSQKNDAHNITGSVTWNFSGKNTIPFALGLSDGLDGNLTVNNLPVTLAPFTGNTSGNKTTDFIVPAGKTWAFNGGYTIAEGASLTRTGKLIIGVDTEAALQTAVALDADTIKLAAVDFALSKQLLLKKTVALVGTTDGGQTSTIKYGSFTGGTAGNSKHMISVQANNVLLQNLVVDGTGYATESNDGSAIHVYKATGVKLDNVVAKNTIAAGLIVNGSEVTATNFHTEGNGWYGVNVDQGENVSETPKFTIGNNCSFAEATAIKADSQNAASSWVVGDGWVMVSKTENKESFKVWQNAASQGINYAIISVPATVVYGDANLPLLSNITAEQGKEIKFAVTEGTDYVKIVEENSKKMLQILKPGKATLSLEYDGVTVTQAVEVLKRTITVSGITANEKTYDGTKDVTLNTGQVTVEGYISETEGASPFTGYTGTLSSADAGEAVPVTISTTSSEANLDKYYELVFAPVTAKVSKAELTVTTQTITEINYNGTMPSFYVDYSGFVNGETVAVLDGTLQFDCPATSTSLADDYTVTPYGLTSNNYAIKYEGATLKIKAIAPTVEIVSTTVSNDKSTVTVKGHVTNNGGTETTKLNGGFKVGDTEKASNLEVDKNGYFTAELKELGNAEVSLTATATTPESLSGSSAATKVDLSKTAQNVRFVTNLTRLVYGSKVTLAAADYAADAEVEFAVSEGGVLTLGEDGKTITATKLGTATITVTATKENYITATAKQTVVVEPKNLTVTAAAITKSYDNTTNVATPNFTIKEDVVDNVTVDKSGVTASFLDKNVGTNKPVVLSGALALTGINASNYTLTQPTNLKGEITSGGNVTVTVKEVKRKYNESALHYSLSFTANGQPIKPIYTGQITVTESNGTWNASLNNVQFPNYGNVSLASTSGTVEIEKGTPKVLTYHQSDGRVGGLLVDAEGWTDTNMTIETDTEGKSYAKVTYDNGSKSVRGVALSQASSMPTHNWNITVNGLRAALRSSDINMQYGQTATLTKVDGFSYSTSNPSVLTLTTGGANTLIINAVGVGTGAVIAQNGSGVVVYQTVVVKPATLSIAVSNVDKTYDGTTVANPSLAISGTAPAGVALDLTGISFNYASADAGARAINPTQPIALTGANAANYKVSMSSINGTINARALTVTSPISKYYDGSATLTLTDYNATGLLVGEAAPAITVRFDDANVGTGTSLTLGALSGNYTLASTGNPATGNIVRSTIDAALPATAPSAEALRQRVTLTVRETGTPVTYNTIGYNPTITTTGSGASTTYYISGGDTENYTVVYSSNQLGYGADPVIPGGGGGTVDPDPVIPTVSNPVVAERTATTAAVTWEKVSGATSYKLFLYAKKTDSTPLKIYEFDKDGKLKATAISFTLTGLEEGKAYYVETAAYNALGTLLVKKSVELSATPTGIEAISEGSQLYTIRGAVVVAPAEPLQVAIYSVTGQTLFNDEVSYLTQVPAQAGIYVVVIQKGNDRITEKVFVK